jgi:hypothetical protein
MIGKAILHNIVWPEPGGMQKSRKTPPIMTVSARLIKRPWRLEGIIEFSTTIAPKGWQAFLRSAKL